LPEALPFIEGYGRFTDQIPQPFLKEPFVNKALFFGAVHFSLMVIHYFIYRGSVSMRGYRRNRSARFKKDIRGFVRFKRI